MKNKDDLFNRIFHRTQLSGSYADQLKVSEPNEYDVLMILKLHNPIVLNVGRPGYVAINVPRRWIGIERILDSSGYVMQNKVLEWLRGIMKRIFPSPCQLVRIGDREYRIKHDVNGPANTLTIQCASYSNDSNSEFSMDFVGALEFPVKEFGWLMQVYGNNRFWTVTGMLSLNRESQLQNRSIHKDNVVPISMPRFCNSDDTTST